MRKALCWATWVLILSLSCSVPGWSIQPVNRNLSREARQVLDYLESTYQKQVLAGYNVYSHSPDDYEQTGKQAAIWGRDIEWLGDVEEVVQHAKRHRYILTLHWHWFFADDSAWSDKRKTPVDVGKAVTPGTEEYKQVMIELDAVADTLQVLEDARIPVLWRPLHEIDGGWFWWTDTKTPENTAALWRLMYNHFTHVRKLDNLIWVYSAGVGKKEVEYRKRFYPGVEYVDISGIDIYGVDFKTADAMYGEYHRVMSLVSPGKMLACGECDAIPNPTLMQQGKLPIWLYALPWWGAPTQRRPVDWALMTMRHDFVVTLDELPAFGEENIVPQVGILSPFDDGSACFTDQPIQVNAYAVDRDGKIERVELYANDELILTDETAPFNFNWSDAPPGCYELTVVAVDNQGAQTRSNKVRTLVGLTDVARGKPVVASSGESPGKAVDGDYYTEWVSDNSDDEWFYVDLGRPYRVDRVNLLWGWKIHAADFAIDVAVKDPDESGNWTEVSSVKNRSYQTWEATDRVRFELVEARYVRLRATKRAGHQKWAGYQLTAMEIPVAPELAKVTLRAAPETVVHDLTPLHDAQRVLVNPHKGWYHHFPDNHIDKYQIARDADLLDFPGMDHLYIRLAWAYLEPREKEFHWDVIDQMIEKWTAHGLGIAFRISCKETSTDRIEQQYATPRWVMEAGAQGDYYRMGQQTGSDGPWEPVFDDPVFLTKLDQFLAAFAARYDGKPWLRYLDIGSIGDWGEGHTWAGSRTECGFAARKQHVDLHLKHFHHTQLVASDDFVYALSDSKERQELHQYLLARGISYRDDSILVNGYLQGVSDAFTVRSPEFFADAFQHTPTVFELEHYSAVKKLGNWEGKPGSLAAQFGKGKQGPDYFRGALELLHASYVGYHGDAHEWLADNPNFTREILNRCGYWLFPTSLERPARATAGTKAVLTLTLENRGVAPTYQAYELRARLLGEEAQWVHVVAHADRSWLPGEPIVVRFELPLPAEIEPGTYQLELGLFDTSRSPVRPVEFALKASVRDPDGYYRMGKLSITSELNADSGRPMLRYNIVPPT